MAKKTSSAPPAAIALYQALVATQPEVELKGATMPYTSCNGHMFSFLTPTGTVALRLPSDQRQAFLDTYQTRLCEQYGAVMKEYVEVPDSLLLDTQTLASHFARSYQYVASLPPKPTKRPRGGGAKKTASRTT